MSHYKDNELEIPLKDIADGDYILSIYGEQTQMAYASDSISKPVIMKLSVTNGVGTISEFSGTVLPTNASVTEDKILIDSSQAINDASFTYDPGDYKLKGLMLDYEDLVLNKDYVVNGNTITLKGEFLATLSCGIKNLTLMMNGGNAPKITITIDNLNGIKSYNDAITGNVVYYGNYKNQPLPFYIYNQSENLFLSKYVLSQSVYRNDESGYYYQSELEKVINGYANTLFSNQEREYLDKVDLDDGVNPVYQANLFPLSYAQYDIASTYGDGDIAYDFFDHELAMAWWLFDSTGEYAETVFEDGDEDSESFDHEFGVRPAMQIASEKILFLSSAVDGKKSGTLGADALKKVSKNTINEWKLTLNKTDDNFKVKTSKVTSSSDKKTVKLSYENAKSGDNCYVSAYIKTKVNNHDQISYYGRIKKINNAGESSGNLEINLPDNLAQDATLVIFSEEYNGDYQSDYAGKLNEVSLKQSETFTPEITEGNNSQWTKGSKNNLSFTSNAEYRDYQQTEIDGKVVAPKYLQVKEGSTIVRVGAAYLETLSVGKHTLSIVSNSGIASTQFTIIANTTKAESTSPRTGDHSNVLLWSLLGVSALLIMINKKKEKK